MNNINIKLIVGSTRQKRFSKHPTAWINSLLENVEGVETEILDLRDYKLPFFNEPISPMYVNEDYPDAEINKWAEKISEADAFIIVTPEYNHGYPGVLKNAMDSIYKEWNKKPVGFVSYGESGGAKAIEQLKLVSIELGMIPISREVKIQNPWNLVDENNDLIEKSFDNYNKGADKFIEQLMWFANLLKQGRNNN